MYNRNVLIQVRFAVLQYAKFRMWKFYYDCLTQYIDWDDFKFIQTNTDSLYYAIIEDRYNKLKKIKGWFPPNNITFVDIGKFTQIFKMFKRKLHIRII